MWNFSEDSRNEKQPHTLYRTGTLSRSELIAVAVVVRSRVDIKKCNHTHTVSVLRVVSRVSTSAVALAGQNPMCDSMLCHLLLFVQHYFYL
jgi:ABC-type transporter Mla MlaB component